jgi:hypothetical protein
MKGSNPLQSLPYVADEDGNVLMPADDVIDVRNYIKHVEDSNVVWKLAAIASIVINVIFMVKVFILS